MSWRPILRVSACRTSHEGSHSRARAKAKAEARAGAHLGARSPLPAASLVVGLDNTLTLHTYGTASGWLALLLFD